MESFYRLTPEQQSIIRLSFQNDLSSDQELFLAVRDAYPKLMGIHASNPELFLEQLTPEIMLDIDRIDNAMAKFREQEELPEEINIAELFQVAAVVNGVHIPVLFDLMTMGTAMSTSAYFKSHAAVTVTSGIVEVLATLGSTQVLLDSVMLQSDADVWITVGLEFLYNNRASIDFSQSALIIGADQIPFA